MSLRVIIHAIGSAGDVHPFLGIGKVLKARGHEVFLVTSGAFRETVLDAGLSFRELGSAEKYDIAKADPDLWHPRRAFPAVVRHAVNPSHARIFDVTRELQVPGKTVLLASSLAFGALAAAECFGLPLATVHLTPAIFPSVFRQPAIHGLPFGNGAPKFLKRLQWRLAGRLVDHVALPECNRFRAGHGLQPLKHLLAGGWNSPDRVIALFPAWFAPPQPDWPSQLRITGFPMFDECDARSISPELEDFLQSGEPPVAVTLGSAMTQGQAAFIEAAAALEKIGRRGLFLTSSPLVIPGNRHAVARYAPFSQVLPRCAAIVHHGGIGTCAQALHAGIPQLIQPMAHDQLDTVMRVRDLGAGSGISPRHFREKPLAAALTELLETPRYRENALAVSARFRPTEWLAETCEHIEALADIHSASIRN